MSAFCIRNHLLWWFIPLVLVPWFSWAFCPRSYYYNEGTKFPSNCKRVGHVPIFQASSQPVEHQGESSPHPMAETSFLSHVMLKVPSVDRTVDYWTRKGAKIRMSRPKNPDATNGDVELLSAFVELGCSSSSSTNDKNNKDPSSSSPICFALELVSSSSSSSSKESSYSIGNAISYIGVSMLMQFQNNLLGVITGQETTPAPGDDEPNGIRVQSVASAPGDFLARLALHTKNLTATQQFYTSILGMEAKAQDETMLCLRYDNSCFGRGSSGVPTTLVFDFQKEGELQMGDCFDHFVIATKTSIEDLYARFSKNDQCKIFMKPTDMFGKKVMGLFDPNGYKVILASASSSS